MSTDPWTFEVDGRLWLPVPPPAQRTPAMREAWLEAAMTRARAFALIPDAREDEWHAALARIFDNAPEGRGAVFFPIGVFAPTYVAISTDAAATVNAAAQSWLDDSTANVDARDVDHAHLDDARLVLRVEDGEGGTTYAVGLFGTDAELGVAITGATPDPVVAGQLGEAGMTLIASFSRAATSA